MALVHSFDPPERFVAGTVGEPGERTFFLQARRGREVTSVALEKSQVAALAERLAELLDEVTPAASTVVPIVAPVDLEDRGPLEQPITEQFRVGTMTLSWAPEDERVVIELFPIDDAIDDVAEGLLDDEVEPSETMIVRIDPAYARAFVKRAELVVEAGRPSCPFCGNPIDPEGHLCVRANGFKRRDPV